MKKINQFDIWIADLNPQIGTETGKIRPVLVVQTDLLNAVHPSTIICPLTTKIQKEAKILRIHLKQGTAGLSESCDIMLDQIRAIDNKRLTRKIGALPQDLYKPIIESLKIILNLE